MEQETIHISGIGFLRDLTHFSFPWPHREINDMSELGKLALFPDLTSASFTDTNLDDRGMYYLCMSKGIENLCLQGTAITNRGIQYLAELPRLKHLRLKNSALMIYDGRTVTCVKHSNIHRTPQHANTNIY